MRCSHHLRPSSVYPFIYPSDFDYSHIAYFFEDDRVPEEHDWHRECGDLIDAWKDSSGTKSDIVIHLAAGWHRLRLDYYERWIVAHVALRWDYPFGSALKTIPAEYLRH